ncbi:MAG: UDP-N-acetylmuramoyl-L-alanyl-D-glutamate--2,6-diaminopimelate ligase [Bacteroidales bacterium]|jgi:UDP-N-acetylmuramoyl-L-alanyl-D-glutamate--2,6-diaminopimelate ligase|nr:UDP-N-acetylmuramoyl-L-alanyl-D-glutamate--2,6-diaminopimelate ligase [Bacteroidales bacterium]
MTKNIFLDKLFDGMHIEKINDKSLCIKGISCHTDDIREGYLFVCLPGYVAIGGEKRTDTHHFAKEAITKGAIALVCQQDRKINFDNSDIPIYYTNDAWSALSLCSSRFYDQPSKDLRVIGITGTNGKTTLAYMVEAILQYANKNVGVISTINRRFKNLIVPSVNTTPEANKIHQFMRDSLNLGAEYIVMEVTSHALELKRVKDIKFDICVFTNLSQDHLDFHGTMENYFNAKKKLIQMVDEQQGMIITNVDNEYGYEIKNHIKKGKLISFGIQNPDADMRAVNIDFSIKGTVFDIHYKKQVHRCFINTIGEHNVSNALAAIAVGVSQGINIDICANALAETVVPGRSQFVSTNKPFSVVVDFAHTPDGIEKTLCSIRLANPRRIICIFGCGGNRDKTKRPIMGKMVDKLADYIIVTSDNPRDENPNDIIEDIKKGINRDQDVDFITDRYEAIKRGLLIASENDIVIVLGRGHEEYQTIRGKKVPFSDVKVIDEILNSHNNNMNLI